MDWRYCPQLTSETKEAYLECINKHACTGILYLPNKDDDPELHDLVINFYQKHTHSKTCRKYKNSSNFDLTLANSSEIEPLPDDLADELKQSILEKQKEILASVKEKINQH